MRVAHGLSLKDGTLKLGIRRLRLEEDLLKTTARVCWAALYGWASILGQVCCVLAFVGYLVTGRRTMGSIAKSVYGATCWALDGATAVHQSLYRAAGRRQRIIFSRNAARRTLLEAQRERLRDD